MRFRIRYADRIVGSFILLALALVLFLVIFIGMNQRLFQAAKTFHSEFSSASSLNVGATIQFRGFEIGRITSITLKGDLSVDVEFMVYQDYVQNVTENSVLDLVSSPIGLGTSIQFYKGFSKRKLEPGALIASSTSVEGKRLIEESLVDMPKQDDTIAQALSNINPILEGAAKSLNLVNAALEGKGSGPIQDILLQTKAAIAGVTVLLNATDSTLAKLSNTVSDLSDSVQSTLLDMGSSLDTTLTSVSSAVPTLIDQFKGVTDNVNGVVGEANRVIAQVNAIAADLKKTSEAFSDPTGLVTRLLDPKGSIKTLLDDKGELYASIQSIASDLGKASSDLTKQAGAIADNLTSASLDIKATTAGVAAEVPKLSSLILETRKAIVQAQDVLEGLKNNPLLKGGISDKTAAVSAPQDSRGDFK